MGIESFNVVLRAKRTASIEDIRRAVLSFPNVHFVKADECGLAFEFNDDTHLMEILLRGQDSDAEFDLCVRFALCNPDGIEEKFKQFVTWAACQWRPTIWQLSSAKKGKTSFEPEEVDLFLKGVTEEIDALRRVWQRAFGSKRGPVRVDEVFRWIKNSAG